MPDTRKRALAYLRKVIGDVPEKLVCESGNNKFVVLKVPNIFLFDNRDIFDTKSRENENVIRLHLAAYQENRLVDERVSTGMDFSRFEIKQWIPAFAGMTF